MSSTTTNEISSHDKVLQAAQQLIIEHGYVDFSMRELAEASGLAKATIYHHFPDKQTICKSVIEIELVGLRDRLVVAAQSSDVPSEQIRAVIEELFGPEIERRIVLLLTVREIPALGKDLHEIISKYHLDLVEPIAKIIQNGIDSGDFRPVDIDLTVLSLMGMMQSFVTQRIMISSVQQYDNLVQHTTDLLLTGISQQT